MFRLLYRFLNGIKKGDKREVQWDVDAESNIEQDKESMANGTFFLLPFLRCGTSTYKSLQ